MENGSEKNPTELGKCVGELCTLDKTQCLVSVFSVILLRCASWQPRCGPSKWWSESHFLPIEMLLERDADPNAVCLIRFGGIRDPRLTTIWNLRK
jgi:hypothetical protein